MNYPLPTVPLGVMQFHNSKESKLYMVKRWMEFSPIQNAYQTTQAESSKNAITIINIAVSYKEKTALDFNHRGLSHFYLCSQQCYSYDMINSARACPNIA